MDDFDPDISNGTCYYRDGSRLSSRYIPCGNGALGHKTCCESLDMCLSSRACYNGQYGVTYLAGCTDPNYQDATCPDKTPFQDQQWAGLVLCQPTYNDDRNEWIACEDEGMTISSPAACTCPKTSRTVAFTDSTALDNIMSLPASHGGTVTWKNAAAASAAHSSDPIPNSLSGATSSLDGTSIPTSTRKESQSVLSATSRTSFSTSSIFPTSNASQPISQESSSAHSLGKDAIIGVVFGVLGAVIIVVLLGLLCRKCLKRRRDDEQTPLPPDDVTPHLPDPDLRSTSWSGHKSELAADESTTRSPIYAYGWSPRPESAEVGGNHLFPRSPRSPKGPVQDGGLQRPGHQSTCYELPA
ncbi:uncharacterized protein A1O9_11179 [Exophiala aquamarina CBS 119918]|uniref:Mid2 domain-containing protein n=1 Tax=Exophiala aquamarina CBS 119918 TaxID=1182545 RepID=A0A072NZE5_9EURO|nr:uncharacterized protein A1O9_11179 [Exophiala aquamarina CBS 119918]KEF52762.1 hypothetical protein A1O9_11179 [Exophiala aquamarina CBS 119918]